MRNFALPALLALVALIPAAAESGSFDVSQNGHAVGTASYQITSAAQGYESSSVVRVAMQGLNYALSKTEQLTSANQLTHAQLSATVNGSAVNVVAAPDATQILLNISANGHRTTTRLASHAGRSLSARLRSGRA